MSIIHQPIFLHVPQVEVAAHGVLEIDNLLARGISVHPAAVMEVADDLVAVEEAEEVEEVDQEWMIHTS